MMEKNVDQVYTEPSFELSGVVDGVVAGDAVLRFDVLDMVVAVTVEY